MRQVERVAAVPNNHATDKSIESHQTTLDFDQSNRHLFFFNHHKLVTTFYVETLLDDSHS